MPILFMAFLAHDGTFPCPNATSSGTLKHHAPYLQSVPQSATLFGYGQRWQLPGPELSPRRNLTKDISISFCSRLAGFIWVNIWVYKASVWQSA